jgi:hypothetical protein
VYPVLPAQSLGTHRVFHKVIAQLKFRISRNRVSFLHSVSAYWQALLSALEGNATDCATSLPPPVIRAVIGGLDVIERDSGPLESLRSNIKYLKGQLRALGHEVKSDAPITPLRVPADMDMRAAFAKFEDLGIFVNSIEYPALPITKQEFRISLLATH